VLPPPPGERFIPLFHCEERLQARCRLLATEFGTMPEKRDGLSPPALGLGEESICRTIPLQVRNGPPGTRGRDSAGWYGTVHSSRPRNTPPGAHHSPSISSSYSSYLSFIFHPSIISIHRPLLPRRRHTGRVRPSPAQTSGDPGCRGGPCSSRRLFAAALLERKTHEHPLTVIYTGYLHDSRLGFGHWR